MINKKNALLTIASLFLLAGSAFADSAANLAASANVTSHLDLSVSIRENQNGNVVNYAASSLNFGELINDSIGAPMRGTSYFDVVMFANTSKRAYRITQSASQLTNGTDNLPAGACMVTPWTTDVNGGSMPSGSIVDSSHQTFVQSNLVLYSNIEGNSAAPVATYALTNDPNQGATEYIPVDMQAGSYNSNVVITLELL